MITAKPQAITPLSLIVTGSQMLLAILFVLHVANARATYFVLDDDLLPTKEVESRQQTTGTPIVNQYASAAISQPIESLHYKIPFAAKRSPLFSNGRAVLDAILQQAVNTNVRIVGRPDGVLYKKGKIALLAQNRANNIKKYLVTNGIPESRIKIEINNTPNTELGESVYPCDIYLGTSMPVTQLADAKPPTPLQPVNAKQIEITAIDTATSDQIYQYITKTIADGKMNAGLAVKLIHTLADYISTAITTSFSGTPTPETPRSTQLAQEKAQPPAQQTPSNALPASGVSVATVPVASKVIVAAIPDVPSTPTPLSIVASTATERKTKWFLDKKLTLKDNIDAWSKMSNWQPTVWEASNYYAITADSTLEGTFPDVLRQISDATGLSICVKKHEKYIHVTDANVSCLK